MNNYIYYCKDFEKFGNTQQWSNKIVNIKLNFIAERNNNNSWYVEFLHQNNKYSISFNEKFDYSPTLYDRNPNYKYWTFLEVKREIEDLAFKILNVGYHLA